jgi:hypothetical protein
VVVFTRAGLTSAGDHLRKALLQQRFPVIMQWKSRRERRYSGRAVSGRLVSSVFYSGAAHPHGRGTRRKERRT